MFMLKKPLEQLCADSGFVPDKAAKLRGLDTKKVKSISPARNASASLVSLAKKVNETCWMGTLPPHQCGFASSSSPLVGSRLLISHGPLPMTRVPGCPNVAAWACSNCFSKIIEVGSAGTFRQLASGWVSVTVTVYGPVAVTDLTPV